MITRSSITFEDFLGSSIAPQVMPPWGVMKMKVMMMVMMKKNKTKMIEHDKGCPGRLATAAILTPSTTPKKKEIIMTVLMKMITLMRMVIQCPLDF